MSLITTFQDIKTYHKQLGYDYSNVTQTKKIQYFRENALALYQEVAELVSSTPWKPWRSIKDQKYNVPNAAREVIDCIFFLGAICEILGISSEDLEVMFKMVLKHNYTRIESGYNNEKEDRL